jgi:hypothetical protein
LPSFAEVRRPSIRKPFFSSRVSFSLAASSKLSQATL